MLCAALLMKQAWCLAATTTLSAGGFTCGSSSWHHSWRDHWQVRVL